LVEASQDVLLLQGLELLELSSEQYGQIAESPFDASIGQHYRHAVEHFQCLLNGAASGEVNYDVRQRDRKIETDKMFGVAVTRCRIQELETWTETTLEQRCRAISSLDYESDLPLSIPSNLGRELTHCIGRTVHHFAIIRLVCGALGVNVPARFGYAPSTIKQQSSVAAYS
jgi:hypothetical protein